ncbi:DUF924 domain-containing protein [Myxococcota bacterium]|nr:DUF924 domain-containing protein [Myxococcota bacterium]
MSSVDLRPEHVLEFWFEELDSDQWWTASDALDREIGDRFGTVHAAGARCELDGWRATAEGRLAEIIVLDQFSRSLYRGDARAFAFDGLALALAQTAVAIGADRELAARRRAFLYMPYMHSESPSIHVAAVSLFGAPGMEGNLGFELAHKRIIDRFGRYPHRNAALGRLSTSEEIEFLKTSGSSF